MNTQPLTDGSDCEPVALPHGVLCAGLFGSGSTWAFNVAASALRKHLDRPVARLYADQIDEVARQTIHRSDCFVTKTHLPDASVSDLCRSDNVDAILTVRDPRDAVSSIMERFGKDFSAALAQVEKSASLLLYLWEQTPMLVLKYEEAFTGKRGITAIAAHLGVALSSEDERSTEQRFSAPVVARRVARLLSRGVFSGKDPAMEWEAGTQWHPFHVGDGRIGKFRALLTTNESDEILYKTEPFCAAFGYELCRTGGPVEHACGRRGDPRIEGWIDHFSAPNLVSGWVRSDSGQRLQVLARHEGRVIACAEANRFRPDLAGIEDGCFGFQLKLLAPFCLSNLLRFVDFEVCRPNGTLERIEAVPELHSSVGQCRTIP